MTLQTEILSTETSDILKQIIILKSAWILFTCIWRVSGLQTCSELCIPAKFHDFSVMLTNLKDAHDLTIIFSKKAITHEFEE